MLILSSIAQNGPRQKGDTEPMLSNRALQNPSLGLVLIRTIFDAYYWKEIQRLPLLRLEFVP